MKNSLLFFNLILWVTIFESFILVENKMSTIHLDTNHK